MRKKKPYSPPRILAREKIETRAVNCLGNKNRPGKASILTCAKVRS